VLIGAEWAHGFYALEDTVFEYLCLGAYDESAEACFSIAGVLRDALGLEPLLSPKDRAAAQIRATLADAPAEGA
jgi:dTDP-4-dehydrorhamnose 3,5-epimerase